MVADPRIDPVNASLAWQLQTTFPAAHLTYFSDPRLQFATKAIAVPTQVLVPTRHGPIRALVYSPHIGDIRAAERARRRPPVHVLVHGGAFIIRMPEQEDNVARYLASEVGCYVVMPDYSTAPEVCFPVAEHQVYDVFRWVRSNARLRGWDDTRMSVGGPSAGTKLAIGIVQQCLTDRIPGPVALTSDYGTCDLSRSDRRRPSESSSPVVTPALTKLIRATYFAGADLTDPLVSPYYDDRLDKFPPTLVVTAEFDTLKHEMREFADALGAEGVPVTYRELRGVDHGFTHMLPVSAAHEALELLGAHLRGAFALGLISHAA